jgi:hypothetical protein
MDTLARITQEWNSGIIDSQNNLFTNDSKIISEMAAHQKNISPRLMYAYHQLIEVKLLGSKQ